MNDDDVLLRALVDRLRNEEHCQTVILYGSRARGQATPESDWDVIAFRETDGPVVRETGLWHGGRMDMFIYPISRLERADDELMHVRGGLVLLERDGSGRKLLARLDEIHARGPDPLPADELAARRAWAWKMLDRASREDVEGHYRRAWLLTTLLEHHFLFQGSWYPGPKIAFETLRGTDSRTHALFENALAPNASLHDIAALVEHVNGPRS